MRRTCAACCVAAADVPVCIGWVRAALRLCPVVMVETDRHCKDRNSSKQKKKKKICKFSCGPQKVHRRSDTAVSSANYINCSFFFCCCCCRRFRQRVKKKKKEETSSTGKKKGYRNGKERKKEKGEKRSSIHSKRKKKRRNQQSVIWEQLATKVTIKEHEKKATRNAERKHKEKVDETTI